MNELAAMASQLIRRPVAEVFDAFVDPTRITQFWLKSASAPLATDARVTWHFMVPGATQTVIVTEFKPPRRIAFAWAGGLNVELDFEEHEVGATRVAVSVTGFEGSNAALQAVGTTEGFSIVLCDLKTLLEAGRSANLVKDKATLIAESARKAKP
jgi:uncharacterized protein YndB with AHSA1/START domain